MSIKGFEAAERNYLYSGGGQEKQHRLGIFNCRKCHIDVPDSTESKLIGVCENCYIEHHNEEEDEVYNGELVERREAPKPKYVIDLDKIREDMTTYKTNRNRKGETI